jgi:hypothetical protein
MKPTLLDALRAVHERYVAPRQQRPTVTTACDNCGAAVPPPLGYWHKDRRAMYCDKACLDDLIDFYLI